MDQLGAMRAFVLVVQTGSFSAAAREQGTSQATMSKKVAALEALLGVKLLSRTSRELSLTEVGQDYVHRCVSILGELDEAESNARSQMERPTGQLRISAPVVFGRQFIGPILTEFLKAYPELNVDLHLSDKHVDLIAERIDIAIRAKKLEDSTLVARHLFDNPMVLVAAPSYLETNAAIITPEQLTSHNCILYSMQKSINVWYFNQNDQRLSIPVSGNCRCDNGDVILQLAIDGSGIAQLPIWMVREYIDSGQLAIVLSDFEVKPLPFNAVYPQNRYVPLKVRRFVEFIKTKIEQSELYS
ncbi:LysR family transcriptional regulator [Photobacterium toruni]|uniref:LysR family transcriptional regulator n=1 Tax=Photobacterium toruni TaxID=1935446 RepID=A0ABU6L2C0_9GAMM|nr:LysR family transcriptional regulator [Photobacterium toruni]